MKPWGLYVNFLTPYDRNRLLDIVIERLLETDDRRRLLDILIERLIETEELKFRQDAIDAEECFYWPGSGNNVLEE